MDCLDSIELGTVVRSGLVSLAAAVTVVGETLPDEMSRRIKTAAALFETVLGRARYDRASDQLPARVYEAVMTSLLARDGWTDPTARLVIACFGSDKSPSCDHLPL